MGSVYKDAIALPMDSGKPIALGTKEDMEMINTYSLIQKDETKEGEQITEKKAWGRESKNNEQMWEPASHGILEIWSSFR